MYIIEEEGGQIATSRIEADNDRFLCVNRKKNFCVSTFVGD